MGTPLFLFKIKGSCWGANRTMERMTERLSMDGRPSPRENQEQQNMNQNARRPQIPHNMQIYQIIPPNPPVRPPLQKKYVHHDGENLAEDEIHQLDTESPSIFLTK